VGEQSDPAGILEAPLAPAGAQPPGVMAELRFSFGTMGSGKSTLALQVHHNLSRSGQHGLLLTQLDRLSGAVSSRLGVAQPAIEVSAEMDLVALARSVIDDVGGLHFLVCDETHFYTVDQAVQLANIVDELDVEVYAFGLLTDFRGRLFPSSARLLELADTRHELRVEARCWCNRPATHNARLVDGRQVYEGDTVVVGDIGADGGGAASVTYELRCRKHWLEGRSRPDPPAAGPGPRPGTTARDHRDA
jgi:thymidine kinase